MAILKLSYCAFKVLSWRSDTSAHLTIIELSHRTHMTRCICKVEVTTILRNSAHLRHLTVVQLPDCSHVGREITILKLSDSAHIRWYVTRSTAKSEVASILGFIEVLTLLRRSTGTWHNKNLLDRG
jgi:hypothetical protein